MKMLSTFLLAGSAIAAVTAASAPAQAGSICPTTGTTVSTCNLFYTFNANGSIFTSGAGGSFDNGGDDSLVGVINNTTHTLYTIGFTAGQATDIFGFDNDGIDVYTGLSNGMDNTGYGGADAYFTNIQSAFGAGTVNFIGGIAPGSTGYFSLENSVSISAPPMLAPEPSTWAMMIVGFLGLGAGGYWKSKAKVAPLASA